MMDVGSDGRQSTTANPFDEGSLEARLYDALVDAASPIPVATLAARAACDPAAAREHLRSFVSLGVVIEHHADPPTYEWNQAVFEWDAVETLAREHSLADLEDRIDALCERIQAYQDRYDVETPAALEEGTDESGEALEADVAEWTAARAELRRYERARQIRLSWTESTDAVSESSF